MAVTKLSQQIPCLLKILGSCRIRNLIKQIRNLGKGRNHDNRLLVKLASDDEYRSCDGFEIRYRSATKFHYDHILHYYFFIIISNIFT